MFVKPQEPLTLTLRDGKQITLSEKEYYLQEREGSDPVPVIKHDVLVSVAENAGVYVDDIVLEFGEFHSPTNFCFIHRAYGYLNGIKVSEVGEANPNNLDSHIGSMYPAIMSNKRASDRLLIRLLGLQGQIYSDVEFSDREMTTTKKAETEEPEEMSLEEAKGLIVDYGRYRTNPITLAELKEKYPNDFRWLCEGYKATEKSSPRMKKLQQGARLLAAAEAEALGIENIS